MRKPVLALIIVLAAAVAAGLFAWQKLHTDSTLTARPTGGDFTLQSSKGPVSLHDFRGKVVLLYFGYTYCPDICPTSLGNLSAAWRMLPPDLRDQVQILFVSVDPKRDTPERLQQYADFFNARIIGLTADKATIDDVVRRYGAVYKIVPVKESRVGYLVDHSAFAYVIDRNGRLVTQIPHGTPPKEIVRTLIPLLTPNKEDTP
ncbi:SCO family protein [Sulfurivirga sp.]|uniref:SCO family protein n=1 Tax=Sulfurivirga sp. TaxID=2614236 RepID=UPI0025DA2B28|nr:SCO family protein [Sulfurivirga sp.]